MTEESLMSSDPQVERCLSAIRTLSSALSSELNALTPAAWDGPTNCAPWKVRDLVAHIVVSGEGFAASIRQGLAGSVEQSISHEERDRRSAALAASDPKTVARELDALTDRFIGLYDGLDDAGLDAICFHRRGNRSVRWYAAHRLAEVAFHSWDFQVSLDRDPEFSDEIAALLLPTILESNAPRTYAAGLSEQRGTGERYALAVVDDPSARWLVTIDPDRLTAVRGAAPADVTITGPAAALALLLYGRVGLSDLFQSGAIGLEGDAVLAERFSKVFPRP
jgi:uncharacterized protein (TIGR03083 family)